MPGRGVARLAAAKVNLALHVTGRRPDGYHCLDTVAVFADLGDRIEIADASTLDLAVTGPFGAHAPADSTDLAYRAATAFFAHTGLPPAAALRVEKNIPAGAGLGGGSADAAAVLLGLNEHVRAGLSTADLCAIGLPLGADVPMCIVGRALRARGIGEVIDPVADWPALPMVLVWPGKAVSTAQAFGALARRDNPPLSDPPSARTPQAIADWLRQARNDLESPARLILPEIEAALDALAATTGCLLARMSGSGSACFALYADIAQARGAAAAIATANPRWWCVPAIAR